MLALGRLLLQLSLGQEHQLEHNEQNDDKIAQIGVVPELGAEHRSQANIYEASQADEDRAQAEGRAAGIAVETVRNERCNGILNAAHAKAR